MRESGDPHELQRFVDAQAGVYARVTDELRAGRKQSHWMWFIFPQAEGLGFSAMAQRYAIGSRQEAEAYLAHPVLRPRLVECTRLVCAARGRAIGDILGSPDDMKFRSSMTLFEAVSHDPVFGAALDQFYGGRRDQATRDILARWDAAAHRA
ncbi:MAG: DUF1810 domain-containing protein [Xanthobacteraceae bacterium]|nr:DUF1810 domain-containing protein [Xanthobacteraceae bacterium]